MRSRVSVRRFRVYSAVAALFLGCVVYDAGPASAAPPACNQQFLTAAIDGDTHNQTGLPLTRTFVEKGLTNIWAEEPATTLPAHGSDNQWCVYARGFGAAMKVHYALPDGTTVFFEAWRYEVGDPGARCDILGPSATEFRCFTSAGGGRGSRHAWAHFTIRPVR